MTATTGGALMKGSFEGWGPGFKSASGGVEPAPTTSGDPPLVSGDGLAQFFLETPDSQSFSRVSRR